MSSSESEVEFNNTIDEEINLQLQANHNQTLLKLNTFLEGQTMLGKGDKNANLIDRTGGEKKMGSYHISDEDISKFFKLYNNCYSDGDIRLSFAERQLEYSGIMVDFDIKQKSKTSELTRAHFDGVAFLIVRILKDIVQLNCKNVTIAFLKRPSVTLFDNSTKIYKDGIHILLPSIQVKRQVKSMLLQRLRDSKELEEILGDTSIINIKEDMVDQHAYCVPVFLLGSVSKLGQKAPYHLETMIDVRLMSDGMSINKIDIPLKINLPYELSLNWMKDKKPFIDKKHYEIKPEFKDDAKTYADDDDTEDSPLFERGDLSAQMIDDVEARHLKQLLDLISQKRCDDYDSWFKVLCVVANTNPAYKGIAEAFSKRSQKFDKATFDTKWEEILSSSGSAGKKLTIGSLLYWAQQDNPDGYERTQHLQLNEVVYKKIYSGQNEGVLEHADTANFLYTMFRHKFICCYNNNARSNIVWYEFMTQGNKLRDGEIYKWKVFRNGGQPIDLRSYVHEILPKVYEKVLTKLKEDEETDTSRLKDWKKLVVRNFKKSYRNLRNNSYATHVIKASEYLFHNSSFAERMDTDGEVMGVGNGVLLLGKRVQLLTGYHNYPITYFTPVPYVPFNPRDPTTKQLMFWLRTTFPDNEADKFEWFLYFLASSLDGKTKDPIFVMGVGAGSNGKSFWAELMKGVMGSPYGQKIDITFLTFNHARDAESASPAMMKFKTARYVYFNESGRDEVINGKKLKPLTGGDHASGRGLFADYEDFKPHANMVSFSNFKFKIVDCDWGTQRRIKYLSFPVTFRKAHERIDEKNNLERKADISLTKEKTMDRDVHKAMLSLLTYYYEQLQTKYGGSVDNVPCLSVATDTQRYFDEEDKLNQFLSRCVIKTKDDKIECSLDHVIDQYVRFLTKQGVYDKGQRTSIEADLKNSRLAKLLIPTKFGYILRGYRIMLPTDVDTLQDGEMELGKEDSKYSQCEEKSITENAQQYWERICREFDSRDRVDNSTEMLKKREQNPYNPEQGSAIIPYSLPRFRPPSEITGGSRFVEEPNSDEDQFSDDSDSDYEDFIGDD